MEIGEINVVDHKVLLEAQTAIIGSMLIDDACVGDILMACRPEDFVSNTYRILFEACRELFINKKPVDPIAVLHLVGIEYQGLLMDLMQATPTAANCMVYAGILKEQATLHRVRELGHALTAAASTEDAMQLADRISETFCQRGDVRIVSFFDGLSEFWARQSKEEKPDYLPWGFSKLDEYLFAEPGDFIVIGGRPSSGKTMLAFSFAWTMATRGKKRIGIFSLETSDQKLYDRLISHVSGVSFDEIKKHEISRESWEKLANTREYQDVSLDVIDSSGMSVQDIKSISLSRHYDVIFIDYLQLIKPPAIKGNRVEEVSYISRNLQQFARTSRTTVVSLAQLSRASKQQPRKAQKPEMSDLRESGQIEQDADIIMMLYQEDPDNKLSDRKLSIAKNKDGKQGQMTLAFDPEHMRFTYRINRNDEPYQIRHRAEPPIFREITEDSPELTIPEVFASNGDPQNNEKEYKPG